MGSRGANRRRSSAKKRRIAAPQRAAQLSRRPSQTPRVPLEDVDARVAERGDHLGVARVVPLVRPEVEDAQRRRSSQGLLRPVRARARSAPARSSWWLVTISLSRPSEKNWRPTTTSSTPERQQRPVADRLARSP